MEQSKKRELLKELAESHRQQIVGWRRHLHQHPELSFEEFETAEWLAGQLEAMGLAVRRGVGGTGVVATLSTGRPGPVIAFRADMDALPVTEDTGLPFASRRPGVMHACGHDAHMAMVLGAAAMLCACKDKLSGVLKFIFQPGEEANGGARCVIEAGALKNPDVERIYALHVVPELPAGAIGVHEGYMTATDDQVLIRVHGVGGHSSAPQDGVNAVLIASAIVVALQSIQPTQISPFDIATFSICTIKGGEAENIIPDYAEMTGMLRCIEKRNKLIFRENIQKVAQNEAEFTEGFPAVYNDPACTAGLREAALSVMPPEEIIDVEKPHLGSEDYAYYQEEIPGVLFMLGAGKPGGGSGSLHSADLNISEEALPLGAAIFASVALE